MAVVLVVLLATVTAIVVVQLPSRSAHRVATPEVVRADNAQVLAAGLRLVNYYPRDRAWEQQWTQFSPDVTAADFQQIRSLGATSVRLVVFPAVLGYPVPDPDQQRHLSRAVELADAAGLRVWLTLFDNFSRYTDLEGSRAWTTALLTPYADDQRISTVEIRNEIKPSNPAAMTWAQDQIALVHRLLPPTPVSISLNGSVDPAAYATLLASLHPEAPDVVSYHYYGDPGLAFDHFRRVLDAVGPIPVVVGEAGLSTADLTGRCADRSCREAEQVDWYQIVVAAARQAGLAPPAPWAAFDLTPDATKRAITPAGYGYGLFRTDRSAKPAATVVADAFADRWTSAPQNTDFSETSMGGTRARAWVPWRTSGSLRVDPAGGIDGRSALAASGTEALAGGLTSWYARPLEVVRAGQTWRAEVAARGLGATGQASLALIWYDGEGRYLGIDTSREQFDPARAGWQPLTVEATPPPGAGAVRIHLRSAENAGTVSFSDPGWSVTP